MNSEALGEASPAEGPQIPKHVGATPASATNAEPAVLKRERDCTNPQRFDEGETVEAGESDPIRSRQPADQPGNVA